MTPEERAERETAAERALRRGELSEALQHLRAVQAAFPEDEALSGKLRDLEENLQPTELMSAKSSFAPDRAASSRPARPEEEGERLFALGDYAGAAAAYRRALKERPDSELIRDRLAELYQLARSAPGASPTDRALPQDPKDLLGALLDRIAARRRI